MRSNSLRDIVFPLSLRALLREHCQLVTDDVLTEFTSTSARRVLSQIDVLITGWGAPRIDIHVLDAAPHLRLIAHAAGTVRQHIDEECWERGISVTTAAQGNSIPVAEYTLAFILLGGKKAFTAAESLRTHQGDPATAPPLPNVGNHGNVVGIIGASRIGRLVLEHLTRFRSRIFLFDPTMTADEASALGARLVSLPILMAESDVVSLHAPMLGSTLGMIGEYELGLMKDGATFINTSRGALVDHAALRAELVSKRISAVLDVTNPEPLPAGDILYTLPNVIITPHIAGSMGNELPVLGELAVSEVVRLAAGLPPIHLVSRAELHSMA